MLQELIAWFQNQYKKAHFQFKITSSVLEILEKVAWRCLGRDSVAGYSGSSVIRVNPPLQLALRAAFTNKPNLALPGDTDALLRPPGFHSKKQRRHFLVLPQREGRPEVLDL